MQGPRTATNTAFGVLLGGVDMVLTPVAAWGTRPSPLPPSYLGVNYELDRKHLRLTGPAWVLLSFGGLDLSRMR